MSDAAKKKAEDKIKLSSRLAGLASEQFTLRL
jgi:hypothetical protein